MSRFLILPLLLVVSSALAQGYTTIDALEYANAGGKPLLLDLRVPDGSGPYPAIVYLHSGAWITGDRTGGPAIRQASRGYVVASIDYPLAPQFIWPTQIEACKAAVRWLRANAARFHIDPERVGVFGTSAGGHLGAVLGTSGGEASLEGLQLGDSQFSSRVKAVVDFYGPSDLLMLDDQKLPCIPLDGNASYMPPSLLMGCPIQQCREWTETANPIHYISADDPPFLLMHGMLDCLVPFQQSVMLHAALEASGIDSTLILLPNAQHADDQFNDAKYKKIVDDWLDKHLRGPVARRRAVKR
ncbi:MAG TPA: alpha/beta hydrolase [Thermoanaerobaculia bacterium]|nr:alpha/beta hydrolase [Thermoanaerobaculia bacterium]